MIKSTNCSLYLQILSIFTDPIKNALSFRSLSAYNISVAINGDVLIYYPSDYSTVAVGDYYSVTSSGQPVIVKNASVSAAISTGITPIAVVFFVPTTSTDQARGWKHGYALALKNATNNVAWASVNATQDQSNAHHHEAWVNGADSDFDGYDATHYITDPYSNSDNLSELSSSYPAFYHAITFSPCSQTAYLSYTSGWYLPTNAQWYKILTGLGTMTDDVSSTYLRSDNARCWYLNGNAGKARNALNSYLTPLESYGYSDPLITGGTYSRFWCSGEGPNGMGCDVCFDPQDSQSTWYYVHDHNKTYASEIMWVRPVITF